MKRLNAVNPATATGEAKDLLDAVKAKLGVAPNVFRTIANSPAALSGLLGLMGALDKSSLSAPLRAKIALAIAETNACQYCLSAHTYIGKNLLKLDDGAMHAARHAGSTNAHEDAALKFAVAVTEKRGQISDADMAAARAAGLNDGEIVEIIAHVVLNTFTNYVNIAGAVEIDFPVVDLQKAA